MKKKLKYTSIIGLILCLSGSADAAGALRIATWNLEHLDDHADQGCIARSSDEYDSLAGQIMETGADVIAFQEVENAAAAHLVFPDSEWDIIVSQCPPIKSPRDCWDRPGEKLGHLATGFAVRKGNSWSRHQDVTALSLDDPFQRFGADISVFAGQHEIRLLSVHLISGCWGEGQDSDPQRVSVCERLRSQLNLVKSWADDRSAEGTAFVVLGDFNRRLAVDGDWGWSVLSDSSAPLSLLTEGYQAECDPRYPDFIDHLAAGGGAQELVLPGSFREWPRKGEHPDHCAVSADLRLAGQRDGSGDPGSGLEK